MSPLFPPDVWANFTSEQQEILELWDEGERYAKQARERFESLGLDGFKGVLLGDIDLSAQNLSEADLSGG